MKITVKRPCRAPAIGDGGGHAGGHRRRARRPRTGRPLPRARIDAATGEVAGGDEISPSHRGLLGRAFGDLGAIRVAWHTRVRNERSRTALERLGASYEGVHHRIHADGSIRDTATHAMTDGEDQSSSGR
ncbi:GNAT family N-acetyltransferase [Actinomadura graeca]|uniref:GNAT family N-acetyltransferase n=1 Tax=Actinomadura graeca TaxID=2750812 RepID=A0ABX8QTS5_9ACTN|nr:GNAT family protein [Actinomadura graeca]QXJ22141.1 GNAT family N-acetyltransferase [Actinomadura graeca]